MIQVKRSRFPRHPLKLSKCRCTLPLLLLLLLPRGCGCCCYYYYYCCCCWGLLRAKDGMSCVCGACVALKEGRPSYHSYTCDPTSSPPPPSIPSILSTLLRPYSFPTLPFLPLLFHKPSPFGVCVCVTVCVLCACSALRVVWSGVCRVEWKGNEGEGKGEGKWKGRRRKEKEEGERRKELGNWEDLGGIGKSGEGVGME